MISTSKKMTNLNAWNEVQNAYNVTPHLTVPESAIDVPFPLNGSLIGQEEPNLL
jgi:hypothetical protein